MAKSGTPKLKALFQDAYKKNASDLHLLVERPPFVRIDGVLQPLEGYSELTASAISTLVYAELTKGQIDRFESERELDFAYETTDRVRYRVNIHWQEGTIGLAARIVPAHIPTMDELMLPDVVYGLLNYKSGLILATGPTGSGKTTTLASMIQYINENRVEHIITLEDPIEFSYEQKKSLVKQRELGIDFLTFPEALKHVVRQDPNVILIGEMRDAETMAAAVTLAETGHLVFATLHTFTAPTTIDRIIDTFPPHQQTQIRLQLSMILRAILAQRLLPKIGGGRIASREVLINTPAVSNLIRENKIVQLKNVLQTGSDVGMVTMDQDLVRLINENYVDREIALAYMEDKERLS